MTWILKDYDINKDIKIGNVIQLPVADIRIPVAEKEFSTYLRHGHNSNYLLIYFITA
jgi:hypothetical protein